MAQSTETLEKSIAMRIGMLERWLAEFAPYTEADAKHIKKGTVARAYWMLGYLSALKTVDSKIKGEQV